MNVETMAISGVRDEEQRFIAKVYGWMAVALMITAGVAWYVVTNPPLMQKIFQNQLLFFGLIIGELALVGYLSIAIQKMSSMTAAMVFIGYSALNGLTLSLIFYAYTAASLASTFLITAGTFGAMSIYGFAAKKDLTSFGNLLFMGLLGIIIASVVNIFFKSPALYWITTYIGIFVFVGLTAYDTQMIKKMSAGINEESEEAKKGAIVGALRLYLDFINLFLLLLRLFGKRR